MKLEDLKQRKSPCLVWCAGVIISVYKYGSANGNGIGNLAANSCSADALRNVHGIWTNEKNRETEQYWKPHANHRHRQQRKTEVATVQQFANYSNRANKPRGLARSTRCRNHLRPMCCDMLPDDVRCLIRFMDETQHQRRRSSALDLPGSEGTHHRAALTRDCKCGGVLILDWRRVFEPRWNDAGGGMHLQRLAVEATWRPTNKLYNTCVWLMFNPCLFIPHHLNERREVRSSRMTEGVREAAGHSAWRLREKKDMGGLMSTADYWQWNCATIRHWSAHITERSLNVGVTLTHHRNDEEIQIIMEELNKDSSMSGLGGHGLPSKFRKLKEKSRTKKELNC